MTAGSLNRVPADRPSEAPATESEHKGPSKQRLVDDGYEPLLEVPKSFSEIYDISNRNRGRGKEKKRGRDGGAEASDVVMSSPSDATSSLAALESGYFKDSSIALDTSAEATVDLFAEVGWLSSADKSDMLEAHRSEHAGQEGMDGDETRVSECCSCAMGCVTLRVCCSCREALRTPPLGTRPREHTRPRATTAAAATVATVTVARATRPCAETAPRPPIRRLGVGARVGEMVGEMVGGPRTPPTEGPRQPGEGR